VEKREERPGEEPSFSDRASSQAKHTELSNEPRRVPRYRTIGAPATHCFVFLVLSLRLSNSNAISSPVLFDGKGEDGKTGGESGGINRQRDKTAIDI